LIKNRIMATAEGGHLAVARERAEAFTSRVRAIRESLHDVIVGQDTTIDLLLICGLTGRHALLVGVPGLARTLMVKALAAAVRWKFARIQFTPDVMSSDITGYDLLGREGRDEAPTMVFRPGPAFANLVLADEINRAVPKTQSALLEAARARSGQDRLGAAAVRGARLMAAPLGHRPGGESGRRTGPAGRPLQKMAQLPG
jgi:MoxR-like ATPase